MYVCIFILLFFCVGGKLNMSLKKKVKAIKTETDKEKIKKNGKVK